MSDNNEQSKEYIFEHFADYKDTIIEWANNGDERAKDTVYCNPDYFEKTLFKRADNGDIKAQNFLAENYKSNRWNNKETFINQAICSGTQWVINFICTNITEFKENFINEIKKINQDITNRNNRPFYYNFDNLRIDHINVNFLNEIFQLANNGNKDATEIAQYIAETEIISHYLKNGNPEIIKDFIWNYWPKDKDRAQDFANFMEQQAIDGDEDAQEHIINTLYEYMDRNDPYYDFVVYNHNLDWVHDFICEWWGYRELEKIFFEWVREGGSLARERFFEKLDENISQYEALENSNFRKTIIKLTEEGIEKTKNVILENFDFFRDDYIEDSIAKWAEEGDKRAQKIKEDLDIAKSPIKGITQNEQEKRDTGGMNPDDFDYFLSLF